jgi:hypothetical protein
VSEQAKGEEKVVVVVVVFVVIKHALRHMFLEGKSTAKLGIHPQHVVTVIIDFILLVVERYI